MVSHIPNKGQVLQRYYGWYASRTRGIRRRAGTEGQQTVYAPSVPVPLREARRRWAELLHRIFEVEHRGAREIQILFIGAGDTQSDLVVYMRETAS